jgi:hypothetical protein
LAELLEAETEDGSFDQKVALLEEQVSHHVEEEEDELFPKVQKLMDAEQLEGLGQEMTATASELADKEPRRQIPMEVESAATLH